ncbi:MAG: LLM class flavin-dependent oxidoreductase, partial [Nonomuraea sp.]|nr:LLM class flavin-dependent oxidoreductase [Nonomuraea sp.]
SLDLLLAALNGDPVSADGEFFRFREVRTVPSAPLRPVVACTSDQSVRLAAERGLPMLLGMHVDDAQKAATVASYGTGQGHIAAAVGHVADSTRQAVAELRAEMPRWLEPGLAGYVPIDGKPRPPRDVQKYVDFLAGIHPVGSADHCVETITRTAEVTGIGHLILMVEGMGEHARTLENVRRLGAEVLPRLA